MSQLLRSVYTIGDNHARTNSVSFRIGAGDGFSAFVSDSGMVMTCGDGTFGCLGHGDWNNENKPRLIGTPE